MFPKTKQILKKTFYPKRLRIKKYTDVIKYGKYGLKILENKIFTLKQLESIRKILAKSLKKIGNFWIQAFCHYFITKKPLEVRMGNGKGKFFSWVANLPAGFIIAEFRILQHKKIFNLIKLTKNVQSKLGVKLKLICLNDLL